MLCLACHEAWGQTLAAYHESGGPGPCLQLLEDTGTKDKESGFMTLSQNKELWGNSKGSCTPQLPWSEAHILTLDDMKAYLQVDDRWRGEHY